MPDIALNSKQIAVVFPQMAELYDGVAGTAITAGQPVYVNANGRYLPASAAGTATNNVRGVALTDATAGQGFTFVKRGHVFGFTLGTALAYGAPLYLSNGAGSVADGAGSTSVILGRIEPLADSAFTRVLFVDL